MAEINTTHREIVESFIHMLRGVKYEDESIDVTVECLSSVFGVRRDTPYSGPSLVDVWTSFHATTSKGGPAADDAEDDAKLQEFLTILRQRGYFNGVEVGSAEYNSRLEKAKLKFHARQNPYEGLTAEQLKVKGNECMTASKYKEALGFYTKAVELDPANHLYHANRAAANIHLKDYKAAITDCEKSIAVNSTYAKAFSRLGTARFYDNDFARSVDAYRKALDLDPENEGYKEDLRAAEERLQSQRSNPLAGLPGLGPGGLDMSSMMQMMNNPQFMQMATNFMQNPEFSNIVQNFARQMGMQAPNPQEFQSFLQNMQTGNLAAPDDPNALVTPFGRLDRDALQKLQEEEIKNNPKLAAIVEDVRANGPGVFAKYMGDPEVMQIMGKFSSLFAQGGGGGAGGFPPPSNDGGSSSGAV